jgi:hypothetical protein
MIVHDDFPTFTQVILIPFAESIRSQVSAQCTTKTPEHPLWKVAASSPEPVDVAACPTNLSLSICCTRFSATANQTRQLPPFLNHRHCDLFILASSYPPGNIVSIPVYRF